MRLPARFLLCLCLAFPASASAQDKRGEIVLDVPKYEGTTANAPVPAEYHIKNEGGSDGSGLCVISSVLINGAYQGIPALAGLKGSNLWKTAKSRPGGYYPAKLEKLLNEVLPGEKWFSWEGESTDLVREYSAKGFPVATTTNTGALYNYAPIHHMISLIHLDDKWACIVDNNDPGKYHWMPAQEYNKRFRDGQQGWGFVWLRMPESRIDEYQALGAAVLLMAGGMMLIIGHRRRAPVLVVAA